MECCKTESAFSFDWTPEMIQWAKLRRLSMGLDWPGKPRRSADPEITHAAQHGVPLYRIEYDGVAVYDPVPTARWAEFFGYSLPAARQIVVMMRQGGEVADMALNGRHIQGLRDVGFSLAEARQTVAGWVAEEQGGRPPALDTLPESLSDAWHRARGVGKAKSAGYWRGEYQQLADDFMAVVQQRDKAAEQRDKAMEIAVANRERIDEVMAAAGEYLREDDVRIAQLERENRKYRVVLQELDIDPDGIPDLPETAAVNGAGEMAAGYLTGN